MYTLRSIPVVYIHTYCHPCYFTCILSMHTHIHELHRKVPREYLLIYNGLDHIRPYTYMTTEIRINSKSHKMQLRGMSSSGDAWSHPAQSNIHVSMIAEREPKYFTVREGGGLQFVSISHALGQ